MQTVEEVLLGEERVERKTKRKRINSNKLENEDDTENQSSGYIWT